MRTGTAASAVAEVPISELEKSVSTEPAEITCTECGNTEPFGDSDWCPKCGYHPRFGTTFDVGGDGSWEEKPADWSEIIPPWSRVLAAGCLAILGLALAIRLQVPVAGRWPITLLTTLGGMLGFSVAHLTAYLVAVHVDDKLGVMDLLFKPFGLWRPAFKALPKNAWRVWLGGWSLTAVIAALFVVGGIEWSMIFEKDWGFKKRAKPNILQAVVEQAREDRDGGAESLEEAINDFAGEEEAEEGEALGKSLSEEADCIVVGYTGDADDRIHRLLLATVFKGKLKFVGSIPFGSLPESERERVSARVAELERPSPFVDTQEAGTWVQPVLMCRIKFDAWSKSGMAESAVFVEMLADLDTN